ncbi:MAG: LicD family protein [Lachnospiraceae bacterium]|nr:LicD family protein [Lachnospiraceae bacterium]
METYYIKSVIGEIAKGIDRLIEQGIICSDKKVLLYGLDRYSFAMRTILSNKGYRNIEGYVSDDEAAVVEHNCDIKNFACRYLNDDSGLIQVSTIKGRLVPFDENVTILIASKSYILEKEKLERLGYCENIHFYKVYDFVDEALDRLVLNKRRMTMKEMQTTEKNILSYVDHVCRKHNLRYWVCGGTLLGTIRHKGFIPWDDDIDIFLPLQDYRRLIEIFEENEQYTMMGMGTSEVNDYTDMFAKVVDKKTILIEDIGTVRKINPVWIDVFPLVGLPGDEEERLVFFKKYKEVKRRIWEDFYASNGSTGVFSKWYGKQKEFLEKYDFDNSEYVGVFGTVYDERDATTRRVYESTIRMSFEDIEVNVPVGYQEYLDNLYGKDWMQLPDESKRQSHHDIEAYWL